MEKILLFLLQIDLVQSVLLSVHGFHFTNRKDYFILVCGMQISNDAKVAHLFFLYQSNFPRIKSSFFFSPEYHSYLFLFQKTCFLPVFSLAFPLPVHWILYTQSINIFLWSPNFVTKTMPSALGILKKNDIQFLPQVAYTPSEKP